MLPRNIKIRYLNVQHWTDEKNPSLIAHLTENDPDVILLASTSRIREQPKIKIPSYNTFTSNKLNQRNAGSAIAIKFGIKFELLNQFHHDTIGARIETQHGPMIILTNYTPPRQRFLPNQDIEFMIRHQTPIIFAGDMNTRHQAFGYVSSSNPKGRALNQHIVNNRLNYIGPNFPTFYTRRSQTKPDCVFTNNRIFLNYHVQPGGIGPSDHITIDIRISADPILVPRPPIPDIDNTDWDQYKELLSSDPLINLDGGTADSILNEFNKIYSSINSAKEQSTPMKTVQRRNNLKTTSKFKRLTRILDIYFRALTRHGKTPHLERSIRHIQSLIVQEGIQCKYEWWQR